MTRNRNNQSKQSTRHPRPRIAIQYACARRGIPSAQSLRHFAAATLQGRRQATELAIRVVGTRESARLNSDYRGKNMPTNVLSFVCQAPARMAHATLGDLVICAPVVTREARLQHKAARAHWAHMVIHGVLHLLGYDHNNRREARRMEGVECKLLAGLGFADPYKEGEKIKDKS